MDVGIDEAGKDELACGVDRFRAGGDFKIFADARDGFVFRVNVRDAARIRGDDFSITNQQPHTTLLFAGSKTALPGTNPRAQAGVPVPQALVDVDAHLRAIFLHFLTIFGDFGLGLRKLVPGDRRAAGRLFDHMNAIFHRADVVAQAAAYAIVLADDDLGTRADGFGFAVGAHVVGGGWNHGAARRDQVDALMRGVIASDVAEVAADAFGLVNARDRFERKVEVLEVGDTVKAAAHHVRNSREAFFIHPVGETIAEIFNDAEAVVHYRGANLETARSEEQKLRGVAPGGDAAHAGYGKF